MVALDLLLGFGRVGTFGFGGGQAMIPLMEQECVQHAQWMSSEEFLDALAMGNNLLGDDMINHRGLAQGQLQYIPEAAGFHYALAESAFYLGAKFGSATGIGLGDKAGAVRVGIEEKTGAVANGMVVNVH